MRHALRVAGLLLVLARALAADSWMAAREATVFSPDGNRFVRVEPGVSLGETVGFAGAPRGRHATALFYVRSPDRSYRLAAEVELVHPIAPVELLLADSGHLLTLDNWHNAGYGKVVAVYDPAGKLVASWELDELYPAERLAQIPASVSSRWWRCPPFHFVDPDEQTQVYVREALGGHFVFDLVAGTFTYTAGSAECASSDPD